MTLALAQSAAALWGLDPRAVTLAAKRENEVYKVGAYALRLHRPGYRTDDELGSELDWMAALARGGINVPAPLPLPSGHLITRVQGVQVDVLSWLPGEPAGLGAELRVADRLGFCQSLGRLLADLHSVSDAWTPPARFSRPRWDRAGLLGDAPVWGRFWDHPDLTASDRQLFQEVRGKAAQDLARMEPELDFGLIHADALAENTIVEQGRPSLIDFDDSGWGFRTFDLATFLMRFLDVPDYGDLCAAFLQGYAVRRRVPPDELRLFLLLRALTYPGWIIPRRHEPGGQARSDRALATAIPLARDYLGRDGKFDLGLPQINSASVDPKPAMATFVVPDMSCRLCMEFIENAVAAVDQQARLTFDLDRREVTVEAGDIPLIARAMGAAGYPTATR